jgi:S1-C subfamily serine protease
MQYYVRIRGKAAGPFDEDTLIDMKKQGKLGRTSEVSENGSDWKFAEKLEFLYPSPFAPIIPQDPLFPIDGNEHKVPPRPVDNTRIIVLSLLVLLILVVFGGGIYYVSLIRNDAAIARQKVEEKKAKEEQKEAEAKAEAEVKTEPPTEIIVEPPVEEEPVDNEIEDMPPTKSKKKPRTTEEIVELVEGSVAFIKGKYVSGSGFIIRPNIVATNKHVVDNEFMELSTLHFPSASEKDKGPYKPKLLYVDPELDIAFLRIETKLKPIPVAENHQFKRGQDVFVIGNPGVYAAEGGVVINAVNKGVLSSQMTVSNRSYYQLGITINSGNSGGPVIDPSGHVIGIATLGFYNPGERGVERVEGIAGCIPCKDVLSSLTVMEKLSDKEREINNSKHRAKVAFRMMVQIRSVYRDLMEAYIVVSHKALEEGGTASDGIAEIKDEVDKALDSIKYYLGNDVEQELSKVMSDNNIDKSVRDNLADYYTAIMEQKSYVARPRGNFGDYIKKWQELQDTCEKLQTPLRIKLGVSEAELQIEE